MSQPFIVTIAAEDSERIVLIPENTALPRQREAVRQTIVAKNWLEAREAVNTSNLYRDEGFGWRAM
jgi:hypothetical protein